MSSLIDVNTFRHPFDFILMYVLLNLHLWIREKKIISSYWSVRFQLSSSGQLHFTYVIFWKCSIVKQNEMSIEYTFKRLTFISSKSFHHQFSVKFDRINIIFCLSEDSIAFHHLITIRSSFKKKSKATKS